ncbi:hypothetical protein HDU76_009635, partial [Blyttiomyces sp. JEL0837]
MNLLTVINAALFLAAITTAKPIVEPRDGHLPWSKATAQAKGLLSSLTLEDKIDLVTGIGWQTGRCVGNIQAKPKIGFPGLCLQDSPSGIRFADKVSAFPASINVAATFDKDLMYKHGVAMGEEFRGKGINVALGPVMNFARAPDGGRLWEAQGADPYLASFSASLQAKGIQDQGVIATAKHYILNDQEYHRNDVNVIIDDRTLHEVYLAPFKACVDAGVGAIMCSYNKINGTYACENPETLRILKEELGFQGLVMTDWWAAHDTSPVANAGTDMMMPGTTTYSGKDSYWGPNLLKAVNNKEVSTARIDDMVTRILATWLKMKQDNGFPETNFNSWNQTGDQHVDVQADHRLHIRELGGASTILVKNDGGLLPLKPVGTIAVLGSDAAAPAKGGNMFIDRGGVDGTVAIGWGSGTTNFPYLVSPIEGIVSQANKNNMNVNYHHDDYDLTGAAAVAASADVAIVFVNADS